MNLMFYALTVVLAIGLMALYFALVFPTTEQLRAAWLYPLLTK